MVRTELTISRKLELIREAGNKSVRRLAKDFGISIGTVSNVLKRKRELEKQFEENVNGERCRKLRKTANDEVNHMMWEFFQSCRRKSIQISGPMLQEHARTFAKQLDNQDFKASNGWLRSFKQRHNITSREVWSAAAPQMEQSVNVVLNSEGLADKNASKPVSKQNSSAAAPQTEQSGNLVLNSEEFVDKNDDSKPVCPDLSSEDRRERPVWAAAPKLELSDSVTLWVRELEGSADSMLICSDFPSADCRETLMEESAVNDIKEEQQTDKDISEKLVDLSSCDRKKRLTQENAVNDLLSKDEWTGKEYPEEPVDLSTCENKEGLSRESAVNDTEEKQTSKLYPEEPLDLSSHECKERLIVESVLNDSADKQPGKEKAEEEVEGPVISGREASDMILKLESYALKAEPRLLRLVLELKAKHDELRVGYLNS